MKEIMFMELKRSLDNQIYPCYIIQGKDMFLRKKSEETICALASLPELNVIKLNYGVDNSLINSQCLTPPMMSDYRVVIVDNCTDCGAFDKYINNPNPTTILVLNQVIAEDKPKKKKSTKVYSNDNARNVNCDYLTFSVLKTFIKRECVNGIDDDAVKTLIDYCAYDLMRINSEITKLVSYCDNRPINANDIEFMVTKDDDFKLYELSEYLVKGNADLAYQALDNLVAGMDKVVIIGGIYNQFRKLLFANITKQDKKDVASYLGIKESQIYYLSKDGSKLGAVKVKKIMDYITNIDNQLKSFLITDDTALKNIIGFILSITTETK